MWKLCPSVPFEYFIDEHWLENDEARRVITDVQTHYI